MDFYNVVTECSENFNAANKEITSTCNDLKKNWEGPASLKFFSKIEEVKEILNILKNQVSLFEAAGNQIKVLEEVIKNLKIKKEQLANLEEPDASLSAEVRSLEKQKKELIKEIEEYFDTISSLNAGSFFIDLKLSLSKDTIEKANNVNKTSAEKTISEEKNAKNTVEDNIGEKSSDKVIAEKTISAEKVVAKSTGDKIVDKADEIHQYMEANNYTYCVYGGNSYEECDDYGKSHGLNTTFEESKNGYHNTCCATYVSWVLQEAGLISKSEHSNGANNLANTLKNKGWTKVSANELQPGDVMVFDNHVQIYGDNAEIYNAGSGNSIRGDVTENSGRKNCSYGLRAPE